MFYQDHMNVGWLSRHPNWKSGEGEGRLQCVGERKFRDWWGLAGFGGSADVNATMTDHTDLCPKPLNRNGSGPWASKIYLSMAKISLRGKAFLVLKRGVKCFSWSPFGLGEKKEKLCPNLRSCNYFDISRSVIPTPAVHISNTGYFLHFAHLSCPSSLLRLWPISSTP